MIFTQKFGFKEPICFTHLNGHAMFNTKLAVGVRAIGAGNHLGIIGAAKVETQAVEA